MNIINHNALPFDISLSFELLQKQYQKHLEEETDNLLIRHLRVLLDKFEEYPILNTGIKTEKELVALKDVINFLMDDLFPKALSLNEIKAAGIPFHPVHFYYSTRFKNIIAAAGEEFKFQLVDFTEDEMYILSCTYILAAHYNVDTNFLKPLYYPIPDKHGVVKTYRLAMNSDFVSIIPTSNTPKLVQEDIDLLLQNYDNIDLWREKFPPGSWQLKGFVITNFIDVTVDTVISDLKSDMLNHTITNDNFNDFQEDFKRYFNNSEVQIGFTKYDLKTDSFISPPGKHVVSFILGTMTDLSCKTGFCSFTYDKLIQQHKYLAVSDIDFAIENGDNVVLSQLQNQGLKSCIIAPIVVDGQLIGTLEIVSPNKNDLTSINATRLDAVMPYLVATSKRSIQESENYIKAIIQNKCTAIHPAVLWRFEEEAERYMNGSIMDKNGVANFEDVAFDHVYPLFGQIDVVGSSTVRNEAIQADFVKQLELVKSIFNKAQQNESLAFYEQVVLQIEKFIAELKSNFNTTSEEQLLHFLKNEVNPIMPHIQKLSSSLRRQVKSYKNIINPATGIIYDKRKNYEDSIQLVNTYLSSFLDEKQKEAQGVYPHLFERFKTDGIEHNMYIGQSLVKELPFNNVYLKNLRLWQLTTMCEMERSFYAIQKETPIQLDCASLVLVYGNSLSIRFRVDEKKFDVDGAYNARYEIIKKRIDKAHIKDTNERITQKGKLVIVYSQKKDELEYLRYVQFLQSKNYLGSEIELVTLEDLQGVVGLKAIRVTIDYQTDEQKIRYDDLISEINK